ncbi:MAG: cytochrome b/b6 domain-containing protein [Peptococcaceae bacterium]|nr:cytochrome b/b6 domain-containing protein [Peptococcaceae bacterium]
MDLDSAKVYDRWDFHQRFQHWLIMLSFTLLAITGLLIKFAFEPWAQSLAKVFGSFEVLFNIHLMAAVIMIVAAVYHIVYLIIKFSQGKLRGTMFPRFQDLKDLYANIGYLTGRTKEGPRFGKYSYKEKVDYLAEYWGTPVMVLTGLILWFPGTANTFLPRWVIESSHFMHQGEGLLAILVIFTWHLYAVHFVPDYFPMNRVWLTGKVSREVMEHEYPLELERMEREEK